MCVGGGGKARDKLRARSGLSPSPSKPHCTARKETSWIPSIYVLNGSPECFGNFSDVGVSLAATAGTSLNFVSKMNIAGVGSLFCLEQCYKAWVTDSVFLSKDSNMVSSWPCICPFRISSKQVEIFLKRVCCAWFAWFFIFSFRIKFCHCFLETKSPIKERDWGFYYIAVKFGNVNCIMLITLTEGQWGDSSVYIR